VDSRSNGGRCRTALRSVKSLSRSITSRSGSDAGLESCNFDNISNSKELSGWDRLFLSYRTGNKLRSCEWFTKVKNLLQTRLDCSKSIPPPSQGYWHVSRRTPNNRKLFRQIIPDVTCPVDRAGRLKLASIFTMQVFEITSASSLKRRRMRIFTKRQRSYRNDCLSPGNGMLRLPVCALGGLLLLMLPGAVTARMVAREGLMFGHWK
jgi:hypothetical protein